MIYRLALGILLLLTLKIALASEAGYAIADAARKHIHSADWKPTKSYWSDKKVYYCNFFVAEIIEEAISQRPEVFIDGSYRTPLAREWHNPDVDIPNWKVIFPKNEIKGLGYSEIFKLRKPGDIIATSGHVGIISDENKTISVSARKRNSIPVIFHSDPPTEDGFYDEYGLVVHNDFGWRLPNFSDLSASDWKIKADKTASRFTIRRYSPSPPVPPSDLMVGG